MGLLRRRRERQTGDRLRREGSVLVLGDKLSGTTVRPRGGPVYVAEERYGFRGRCKEGEDPIDRRIQCEAHEGQGGWQGGGER